jgi:transposase-like protein
MPQTCTICAHADRTGIERALARGATLRDIARQYGVGKDAIARHRDRCMRSTLQVIQQAETVIRERTVRGELERLLLRCNLLFDACHEWLTDPSRPERYTLAPRADEVSVVYQVPFGELMITQRASLAELLGRLEGGLGIRPISVEHKHADPRKLVLDTAAQLTKQIELLAKLTGELDERPEINVLIDPQWLSVRATLLTALAEHPDALEGVQRALTALPTG